MHISLHCTLHNIVYTTCCTLHTVQYTLQCNTHSTLNCTSFQYIQHTANCTLHNAHNIALHISLNWTVHMHTISYKIYIPQAAHWALYNVHWLLNIVFFILHTGYYYTFHGMHYTLHTTHCTQKASLWGCYEYPVLWRLLREGPCKVQ